ncbi:MAG: fused MFS/spermidine synthase, partial [Anaerolineae bacterium]|nr:fused MFS/spermidine synthase [Anaerolineae bacterium]
MPQNLGRGYLGVLVFAAGLVTLGVELSASRLLDPWFGNSLIVWASLIGLILLYLAVGYALGGLIADRSPHLLTLLRLTGTAAFGIGLIPTISRPVLLAASRGIADLDAGLLIGSMAAMLILFSVPVTLLGCVSPFAVRLALCDVAGSGRVAGRLYALSTAGSILGAFLPVLLLIPNIGTRRTFAVLSAGLLLVVLIGLWRLRRPGEVLAATAGLALTIALGWGPAGPLKGTPGLVFETESAHNYIQVLDFGTERQLRLNEGEGIHSVYRPGGGLADGVWDYFLIAPAFNPAPYGPERVRRVYIGGLAAGTVAKLLSEAYGPIAIDGVELDPVIIQVGRDWFAMTEPNLNAVAADARWWLANGRRSAAAPAESALRHSPSVYDLILVDAYRPPYIPFHLTTVEFFALARERLDGDGVVAVNAGRTHSDYSLVHAIAATLQQVFPSVYLLDLPDDGELGNTLVIATKRPTTLADFRANLPRFDAPLLAAVGEQARGWVAPVSYTH